MDKLRFAYWMIGILVFLGMLFGVLMYQSGQQDICKASGGALFQKKDGTKECGNVVAFAEECTCPVTFVPLVEHNFDIMR